MNRFPFPDRENSMQELLSDYVFPKIEKNKIQEMFDTAWSIGEQAADVFIGQWGQEAPLSMREVLQRSGVKIIEKDIDYVVGKRRYFCEFFSGTNVLKIYEKSVDKWRLENGFCSYEEGLEVLLFHEYFHYLEWNSLGMTSRKFQVPILKIGKWKIGKTGIPSLSEIGANAFANKCFLQFMQPGV